MINYDKGDDMLCFKPKCLRNLFSRGEGNLTVLSFCVRDPSLAGRCDRFNGQKMIFIKGCFTVFNASTYFDYCWYMYLRHSARRLNAYQYLLPRKVKSLIETLHFMLPTLFVNAIYTNLTPHTSSVVLQCVLADIHQVAPFFLPMSFILPNDACL